MAAVFLDFGLGAFQPRFAVYLRLGLQITRAFFSRSEFRFLKSNVTQIETRRADYGLLICIRSVEICAALMPTLPRFIILVQIEYVAYRSKLQLKSGILY